MEKEKKINSEKKPANKKITKPAEETKESVTVVEKNVNNEPTMVDESKKAKSKKSAKLSDDIKQNKKIASLAYILFFIPLLINNKSPFVRHHANEGLEINIFDGIAVVLLLLGGLVKSSIAWVQLLMIIFTIIGFILLVLTTVTKVYMVLSTLAGKQVSTPWMWNVRIIK